MDEKSDFVLLSTIFSLLLKDQSNTKSIKRSYIVFGFRMTFLEADMCLEDNNK